MGARPLISSSKLLLLTISLWLVSFVFIGLLGYQGVQGFTCLTFLIYGGLSIAFLCASLASSAFLREREWPSPGRTLTPSGTMARSLKEFATTRWLAWDWAFG